MVLAPSLKVIMRLVSAGVTVLALVTACGTASSPEDAASETTNTATHLDPASTTTLVTGATTLPPTATTTDIQLRADGLGVVDFETAAGEVVEVLAGVLGSAPRDRWASAAWVEYVGWDEYGLYLGFSTSEWTGWDGVSRLVGWDYSGGVEPPVRFATSDGVTIGTTIGDLQALYGDTLVPAETPDECLGWVIRLPDGVATLDGPPTAQAQIVRLLNGVGVGC